MIDETMLPREGLFARTFSVLAEIRHPNNSTKFADIHLVSFALSKRLRKRKETVPVWDFACCKLHLQYKREAEI